MMEATHPLLEPVNMIVINIKKKKIASISFENILFLFLINKPILNGSIDTSQADV